MEESYEEEFINFGLFILFESIIFDFEKFFGIILFLILEIEMKIVFGNFWMEVIILILIVENFFFIVKDLLFYFKKYFLYKMCKFYCINLYNIMGFF